MRLFAETLPRDSLPRLFTERVFGRYSPLEPDRFQAAWSQKIELNASSFYLICVVVCARLSRNFLRPHGHLPSFFWWLWSTDGCSKFMQSQRGAHQVCKLRKWRLPLAVHDKPLSIERSVCWRVSESVSPSGLCVRSPKASLGKSLSERLSPQILHGGDLPGLSRSQTRCTFSGHSGSLSSFYRYFWSNSGSFVK